MNGFVDVNQLLHRPVENSRIHRYWEIDHFLNECRSQIPFKDRQSRIYEVTVVDTQGDPWIPIYGRPHHETIGSINIYSEEEGVGATVDVEDLQTLTFENKDNKITIKPNVFIRLGDRDLTFSRIPCHNLWQYIEFHQHLPRRMWIDPGKNLKQFLESEKLQMFLDTYGYASDVKSECDLDHLAVETTPGKFLIPHSALREMSVFQRWAKVFHKEEYDIMNINYYTMRDQNLQHMDLILIPVKHKGTLGKAYGSHFELGVQVYIKGQEPLKLELE